MSLWGNIAIALNMGAALISEPVIELDGREIVVADIVQVQSIEPELMAHISDMVVAKLPINEVDRVIPKNHVVELLKRRVPILANVDAANAPDSYRFINAKIDSDREPDITCFAVNSPVFVGDVLSRNDIISVPCQDKSVIKNPLKYDRKRQLVVAARELPVMTYLGPLALSAEPAIESGEPMILRINVGPVRIERQVKAIQNQQSGDHIFVVDRDKNVLRMPLVTDADNGSRP